MTAMQVAIDSDPWRFKAHPGVWLLILVIVAGYIYAVRVIGPRAVGPAPSITRRQGVSFFFAVLILWGASDWPIHDMVEYLYSAHMLQHMMMSYFMPPLMLLATPRWLFDAVIGNGRARRAVRFLSKPIVAGASFNVVVIVTHIPDLVNRSVSNGLLHYSLHTLLISTALLMWMPICGPDRSYQIGYGGKMIYLFLMSVIPTVPAGWLAVAEGVVYRQYDIPVRVFGLSVKTDQQLAGAVMKTGGTIFLWSIIVFIFFRRFMGRFSEEQSYRVNSEVNPNETSDWPRAVSDSPTSKASPTKTGDESRR
ncbi:MAG: cytochrome c oxidase assembly protein [Ilumatobacteraceae bacterium]